MYDVVKTSPHSALQELLGPAIDKGRGGLETDAIT